MYWQRLVVFLTVVGNIYGLIALTLGGERRSAEERRGTREGFSEPHRGADLSSV
jgi:hypothetical protein